MANRNEWSSMLLLLPVLNFLLMPTGSLSCKVVKQLVQSSAHKTAYKGCFVDKQDERDLKYHAQSSRDMTLLVCNDLCKGVGAKYYGAQTGTECYCGDTFGAYGMHDDAYCDRACMGFLSGNRVVSTVVKTEICGGDSSNSVYEVQ